MLQRSLAKGRAESVFNDMKLLFDTTVAEFDKKVVYERNQVAQCYERILEKQKNMVLGFEMKYSSLYQQRIERLEASLDELTLEQARLTSRVGFVNANYAATLEDSRFEHFASTLTASKQNVSVLDSLSKERQVENIKEVLVEVKNEQANTQRQLAGLAKDLHSVDRQLRQLSQGQSPNINIKIE